MLLKFSLPLRYISSASFGLARPTAPDAAWFVPCTRPDGVCQPAVSHKSM